MAVCSKHHPEYAEDCFRCRVCTISLGGSVRSQEVRLRDKELERDGEAYHRFRKQGLQPPRVDGCATLEAGAESRVEVERGFLIPKHDRERFEAARP